MVQLYKLTKQMRELEKLAETDPEMQEAVTDTLEAVEGEFQDKAQAIATIFLNLEPDIQGIDQEIKRLQGRKKLYENNRARLIEYLRENMEGSGIKKIECPLFVITNVIGREVVVVDDEDEIPDDYMAIPHVEAKPDKRKIMDQYKAGEAVPGTHLERNKSSIRIK